MGWIGASHPDFVEGLGGEVEIGWTLRAEFRGRGLATEGARAAVDTAFAHLDVPRVISLIGPANAASMAVARRLGMRRDRDVLHATSGTPIGVWALQAPSAAPRA